MKGSNIAVLIPAHRTTEPKASWLLHWGCTVTNRPCSQSEASSKFFSSAVVMQGLECSIA